MNYQNRFPLFPKITLINLLLSSLFVGILLTSCNEKPKIERTCRDYMKGRIALKRNDSTLLKEVTSDSLYTLMMLHDQYLKLVSKSTQVMEANLDIHPKEVKMIDENCADCIMRTDQYYNIHLCKKNGKWLVEGENFIYPTSDKINEARSKLADYKTYLKNKPTTDSVLHTVGGFLQGVKKYFEHQDVSTLEAYCDSTTVELVARLYQYAMVRTGKEIIMAELKRFKPRFNGISFNANKVICKLGHDEIVNLHRINEKFVVTGLNNMDSKHITNEVIKNKYPILLRSMKVISKKAHEEKIVF